MVKQYPHIMTVKIFSAGSRDDKGNWVQSEENDPMEIPCRFEANAKSAMIVKEDGTQVVYSGTVYMEKQSDTIPPGAIVEVLAGETVLSKGSVLRFSNGQLNARLWL